MSKRRKSNPVAGGPANNVMQQSTLPELKANIGYMETNGVNKLAWIQDYPEGSDEKPEFVKEITYSAKLVASIKNFTEVVAKYFGVEEKNVVVDPVDGITMIFKTYSAEENGVAIFNLATQFKQSADDARRTLLGALADREDQSSHIGYIQTLPTSEVSAPFVTTTFMEGDNLLVVDGSQIGNQPESLPVKPCFVVTASTDFSTGEEFKQSRLITFTAKTIAKIGNFQEVIEESFTNVDSISLQSKLKDGIVTEVKADSGEEINEFISNFMSKFIWDAPSNEEVQPESETKLEAKTNSRRGKKGNGKVAVKEEVVEVPAETLPGIDLKDIIIPVNPSPGIGNTPFELKIDKAWFEPKESWTTEDWDSFVDDELCTMPDEQFNTHLESGLEVFLNRISNQITFEGKLMTMINLGMCPACFTVKTLIAVTKKYYALKGSKEELAFISADHSEEGQEGDEQPKTKFLTLEDALALENLTKQQEVKYLKKGFNTDEEVFMGDLGAANYKEKSLSDKILDLEESPWLTEAQTRLENKKIQPKTKWWNPFTWFGN